MHNGNQMGHIIWSYSIWLEAFAIYPQLYMLQKIKEIENITSHYMACLGLYRFIYILKWFLVNLGALNCITTIMCATSAFLPASFKPYFMETFFITTSKARASHVCISPCDIFIYVTFQYLFRILRNKPLPWGAFLYGKLR